MSAIAPTTGPRPVPEANATRVAVVAAISATSMLFASLASAYLVRRSFADWQAAEASWPWALIALGIGASGAIEIASRSLGAGRMRALRALAATSAFYLAGALMVVGSIVRGEGLARPHDAFIALLLGVHIAHAILGGGFAFRALRIAGGGPFSEGVFLTRMVTHFLTILLAGVLFLLFVLQ